MVHAHWIRPEFPLTTNTPRTRSSSLRKLAANDLRRGDVLVCWKRDRLSRSLSDRLRSDEAGAKLKSLTEEIDTTMAMGRMVMQVVGSFAEFERSIIKERTKLGLARGRISWQAMQALPYAASRGHQDDPAGCE
jgi:DNA invertase Pin-like site-specific DNA recombinase